MAEMEEKIQTSLDGTDESGKSPKSVERSTSNQISEYSAEVFSEGEIIPGLIGLNLNILHAIDMHMIENAKKTINKLIGKEHAILENVHKNMIAVLKTKIPREKIEARTELEEIVRKFPQQLNALADLETIYRSLNRNKDADSYRRKIDNILKSDLNEDIQIKRSCLLEQGYAILIERTLCNEHTVELRITDLHKILTIEHAKSEGEKQEHLGRGIHFQKQVLRSFHDAYKNEFVDGHVARKCLSLEKFKKAEMLCKTPLPNPIWEHYYAKALDQYYDSLEDLSKFKGGLEDKMKHVTLKAIEKFWFITRMPMTIDSKTFIARAFAYIGHILVKRKDLICSENTSFDLYNDQELKGYVENPRTALEKAYELKFDDISVLTRFGRSLRIMASNIEINGEEKRACLEKAEEMLSKSISLQSDRNWFAYSSRMNVRFDIAKTIYMDYSRDDEEALRYLKLAKEDGHSCFQSKNTRKDMTVLAKICQSIGKFPDIFKYGQEFVKEQDCIHEALDYLFYATHLGDPIDFHWTSRISACLFDLGEYKLAVDWQRKAWFLSRPSSNSAFNWFCSYMLTRYYKDNELNTNGKLGTFIEDFLYTLIYGKNKYGKITETIQIFYKSKRQEFFSMLFKIIETKIITIRAEEKSIMQLCLRILCDLAKSKKNTRELTKIHRLNKGLHSIVPAKETEYVLSDIFENSSLKPTVEGLVPCSTDCKYDFFVCHSHKDADWVNNILLRHLENAFDDQDTAFKGCIADRNFTPGLTILDNILKAIQHSKRVILVLSTHFVESNWCKYEADHALIQSLDLKPNANFVIPVLKEVCEIPAKLEHLTRSNMTIGMDIITEIRRIKRALLVNEKE